MAAATGMRRHYDLAQCRCDVPCVSSVTPYLCVLGHLQTRQRGDSDVRKPDDEQRGNKAAGAEGDERASGPSGGTEVASLAPELAATAAQAPIRIKVLMIEAPFRFWEVVQPRADTRGSLSLNGGLLLHKYWRRKVGLTEVAKPHKT